MITRLAVQNYRSIESLDLELGDVTLFVGRNGSGKSNIIDVLRFVRDIMRHGLDKAVTDRHGMKSIRRWSRSHPYNITIRVEVDGRDGVGHAVGFELIRGHLSFTLSSSKSEYFVRKEEGFLAFKEPGGDKFNLSFKRDCKGSVIVTHSEPSAVTLEDPSELFISSRERGIFEVLRAYLSNIGTYVIFPNTLRQAQKQSNETYLASHGENLVSILRRMKIKKQGEALREINDAMRNVIPELEEVTAHGLGGFLVPRFKMNTAGGDSFVFNVDQMSDGTLRVLGLLVALYQRPAPATIALEEPEQTVHPGVLGVLAEAIEEVSDTRQILVTTHSPDLLDRFDPGQVSKRVIAVEMENGVTTAKPLNAAQVEAVRKNLFTLGQLMSIEGLHG